MTAARDFGFIRHYARLRFGSKQLAERLSACQIFSALTRGAGKVELAFRHLSFFSGLCTRSLSYCVSGSALASGKVPVTIYFGVVRVTWGNLL